MNNSFISWSTRASFSSAMISIASLCSATFSGLSSLTISISPVLWTSLSGLTIAAMNNWLIGCNCNSSFSAPTISKLSLCSNTFSGLSSLTTSISPVLWTSFSGLVNPEINNASINCWLNASFSNDTISILSLNSTSLSGLSILSNIILCWSAERFSQGCFSPLMNNKLIFWTAFSSFSIALTSKVVPCSNIYSSFSLAKMSKSSIFSGLICCNQVWVP